ncbi:tyrosine-type recombinase/integrase [Brevibacillus panacihumi]|uniref:Integrase n=1 Tax=Brevibacillus panacihumi TaxID=497735 RepID=A0A3M8CBE3_9BACL|nr:tyrosine-type recombinase/integrase [Brevibacillus panacihumi]RNB72165.1 integrase [Brevibacillus panacihumi]
MASVQPIRDMLVIEAILNDLKKSSPKYHALFLLGIHTGLRISDMLRLKVKDVRADEIKIRQKKNKKWVTLPVQPELRKGIADYIADKDDDDWLFESRQRKQKVKIKRELDRSTVYKMLNKVCRKYGLRSIGCHTTRKTFGYHLYLISEKNIGLLMEIFGHSDPSITLRYIGITQDTINKVVSRLRYTS